MGRIHPGQQGGKFRIGLVVVADDGDPIAGGCRNRALQLSSIERTQDFDARKTTRGSSANSVMKIGHDGRIVGIVMQKTNSTSDAGFQEARATSAENRIAGFRDGTQIESFAMYPPIALHMRG